MKINRIANFINNSKTAQKLLKNINDNPALYGAGASFVLAAIMRPSLIGVMPFKEKKDKRYSQASAIAAGVVELGTSIALFTPINKSIRKASDNLYKTAGTIYHNNPEVLRQFKSITNRGVKILSLIPISLLRFSLVKPIVNVFFPKDAKDTSVPQKGIEELTRDTVEISNEVSKEASNENK